MARKHETIEELDVGCDADEEVVKDIEVLGIMSKSAENQEHMASTCFNCKFAGCEFQTTKRVNAENHGGWDHMILSWFMCDECNLRCGTRNDLREHKNQHHPSTPSSFLGNFSSGCYLVFYHPYCNLKCF